MNDKEKNLAHLWFDGDVSTPVAIRKYLLERYGTVERVFELDNSTIYRVLEKEFRIDVINAFLDRKGKGCLEGMWGKLIDRNINIIYPGKDGFPEKLIHIADYPRLLYVKGKIKNNINFYNQNIAIVGSRNADVYHTETTRYFARELSKKGINIISGLAKGIDSQAHLGCLDAGGYTVAVLGSGINVPYPRRNIELYERICDNGLVISEYGLDVAPNPYQFPIRNRIISGLSDGVLVACAKKKSGSLITADLALDQGKTVYAFPGRIMDVNSEGNNQLLKMGAICTTEPKDILEDLWGDLDEVLEKENVYANTANSEADVSICRKNALAPAEKIVYSLLDLDPVYVDEVVKHSGLGVTKTISTIYELEKKDMIKQIMRGYYIKKL